MNYTTGDIAEIFDITKGGVRYLEERGIITSKRDETNGYRYFDRGSVTDLKILRGYQSMGFTLNEAEKLLHTGDADDAEAIIAAKQAELARQIEQINEERALLKEQTERIREARANQGRWEERVRPAMYRIPVWEDVDNYQWSRDEVAEQKRVEKSWVAAMPAVSLCSLLFWRDGRFEKLQRGSCAEAETVKKLGLELGDCCTFYPERRCLYTVLHLGVGERIADVENKLKELDAAGTPVVDDILGRIVFRTKKNGMISGLKEFWIPL